MSKQATREPATMTATRDGARYTAERRIVTTRAEDHWHADQQRRAESRRRLDQSAA